MSSQPSVSIFVFLHLPKASPFNFLPCSSILLYDTSPIPLFLVCLPIGFFFCFMRFHRKICSCHLVLSHHPYFFFLIFFISHCLCSVSSLYMHCNNKVTGSFGKNWSPTLLSLHSDHMIWRTAQTALCPTTSECNVIWCLKAGIVETATTRQWLSKQVPVAMNAHAKKLLRGGTQQDNLISLLLFPSK
jgi:hypothetical protein